VAEDASLFRPTFDKFNPQHYDHGEAGKGMVNKILLFVFSFFILARSGSSWAQLSNETLLESMPAGFKVGYQVSHNGINMQEWVPEGETVENWSEMITTQVLLGKGNIDPAQFVNSIGQKWLSGCPGSTPDAIHSGTANGYPVSMLLLQCPLNPQSGKPEATLLRAIKGNDSFYVVQRASRHTVAKDQINQMAQFLATVSVCDTRLAEHPCPPLKPH
jgi:hypothetical protein